MHLPFAVVLVVYFSENKWIIFVFFRHIVEVCVQWTLEVQVVAAWGELCPQSVHLSKNCQLTLTSS